MTTTNNPCLVAGAFLKCPAGSDFSFNGEEKTLQADLLCPFDSVSQSQYIEASQQGRCQCEATLRDKGEAPENAMPLDCECFACPPGSRFGFAYTCETPILANCVTFNCFGQCNGDLNFGLDLETPSPTAAPTTASPASAVMPSVTTAALLLLVAIRMFR